MSVDTYSICPCGNGKKIKFCKCKDSIHDMDRVLKMVEGGQLVPALDRLSTILEDHPDAAWALAIRGRLLIDLREYETLLENAERFIRLQPNNPLALTQRAAADLFRGEVTTGTESMLEALTESGREVDSFVLSVASVLAYTLLQTGRFLSARAYATLSMLATGNEGGSAAMDVLAQLNGAPTIPLLLKTLPQPIDRPAAAEWGERYDEAQGLLRSNKIILAQTKFESLQRSAANEPAVLSGLLTCAIWHGDTEKQSDLLLKLSACESLTDLQRVRFRAMSALIRPETPELSVEIKSLTTDIENVDETEMALTATDRVLPLPSDVVAGLRQDEDEVPPKAAFQILDRAKPESNELPTADNLPRSRATVLLFGKQTDRSAELRVLDVRSEDVSDVRGVLESALSDVSFEEHAGESFPLLAAVQPQMAMIRFDAKPLDADAVMSALVDAEMPKDLASVPLAILGGKSLADSADNDELRFEREVVLTVFDSYDALTSKVDGLTQRVAEIANLDTPPPLKVSDSEIEEVANEDLNRIDLEGVSDESLMYLLQRASQVSATPLLRRCATKVIDSERAIEEPTIALVARMALIQSAASQQEMIEQIDAAKTLEEKNNLSSPRLAFLDLEVRLRAGDSEGFQAALQGITSKHGKDPEVMAQLQQRLMSWGLIRPDGTPQGAPTAPAVAPQGGPGGDVWTPQSAPAAKPSGGEEGGSKLWVPGMD
ncbi:MAG: protein-disulfide isomerase [Planctomycetota bacterium]